MHLERFSNYRKVLDATFFQFDNRPHVSVDSDHTSLDLFEFHLITCSVHMYYVIFIQLLQFLLGILSSALLCYQEKNSELDP